MLINLIAAIIIVWLLGIVPLFMVFKKIMTSGDEWSEAGRYLKKHYINNCLMAAAIWPMFLSMFALSYLWPQKE